MSCEELHNTEEKARPESDPDGQVTDLRHSHQHLQLDTSLEDPDVTRISRDTKSSGWSFWKFVSLGSSDQRDEYRKHLEGHIADLKDRLQDKEQQLATAMAQIQTRDTIQKHQQDELNEQRSQLEFSRRKQSRLGRELATTRSQLKTAKKEIAQQEELITDIRTRQIAVLGSKVSSDFPDDEVRRALDSFFQGEFFSWCSELCSPVFENLDQVTPLLHSLGLLNSNDTYAKASEFLKMDLSLDNGMASFPLLQSALSSYLCREFLTTPYFLADKSPDLLETQNFSASKTLDLMESTFVQVLPDAAMDWRVNTIKTLEKTMPITTEAAQYLAKRFWEKHSFLIKGTYENGIEGRSDLTRIIIEFANLSLRLWKTKGNIRVHHLSYFASTSFQWKSPYVDGEVYALATLGLQTEGRPIGVLMRPLILSQPFRGVAHVDSTIVWLKALAWISSSVDEDETMDK